VLVILCLCGGLVAVLSSGDLAPSETGATATDDPTGGTAEIPEPTEKAGETATIGQPVRDGKFEFVVQKIRCGVDKVGNQYLNEKAQGQFCLVTLTVRNIGNEPQTFSDFDQLAYDSKAREYKPDTEAGIYANEDTNVWLNEINPGNKITGVLVFDIPGGTKLTILELHDSGFSGGVEVSLTT
jgi:hypothetical protein